MSRTQLSAATKQIGKMGKKIMKSHRVQIPKYDLPIRFRPWFIVFTCIIMVILGFLGFTNFSHSLPLNDKLLHFLCFCLATAVFYFIMDVNESARRIWFWRHSALIFTGFTCIFCGGILSEFVQAALPYKRFDWGDVLANLCGSSLGLYFSYHLERYYRHRREIARLYQPLSASTSDLDGDEEDEDSTQLLPTHASDDPRPSRTKSRLADVWDEREELFEIGEDVDEESINQVGSNGKLPHPGPQIAVLHHSEGK